MTANDWMEKSFINIKNIYKFLINRQSFSLPLYRRSKKER